MKQEEEPLSKNAMKNLLLVLFNLLLIFQIYKFVSLRVMFWFILVLVVVNKVIYNKIDIFFTTTNDITKDFLSRKRYSMSPKKYMRLLVWLRSRLKTFRTSTKKEDIPELEKIDSKLKMVGEELERLSK